MSSSLLRIYTSSDAGGPGLVVPTGSVGNILNILDACLVNGYTGHPAAGWTKPFANSAGRGCYTQGAGCGFTLHVNDDKASTGGYGYALITGWEVLTGLGSVGTGTGQFPAPAQGMGGFVGMAQGYSGSLGTGRAWIIAADASTVYMWILTGENGFNYSHWGFGDIYSLNGPSDAWRCMIYGRTAFANIGFNSSIQAEWSDTLLKPYEGATSQDGIFQPMPGHYIARNFGGTGGSSTINRKGDTTWLRSVWGTTPAVIHMSSRLPAPNPADNGLYISPLWVTDPSSAGLRGRFRGLYQILHDVANFSDGQIFTGAGDYAGKTFQIIRNGMNTNNGTSWSVGGITGITGWALEISNTVETN